METAKQQTRRRLVREINILRQKRDALTRDVEVLKAHLLAGKREKERRHVEKKDFFGLKEGQDGS